MNNIHKEIKSLHNELHMIRALMDKKEFSKKERKAAWIFFCLKRRMFTIIILIHFTTIEGTLIKFRLLLLTTRQT